MILVSGRASLPSESSSSDSSLSLRASPSTLRQQIQSFGQGITSQLVITDKIHVETTDKIHDETTDKIHDETTDEIHDETTDEIHDETIDDTHDETNDEMHESIS